MKNLKALLVVAMLLCSVIVRAQSLDAKGFTVQVYMGVYQEDGEIKTYDAFDVYNISFTDGFLVHNILTECTITDSQIYKISNLRRETIEKEPTFIFDAVSGISGNKYKYEIAFAAEGGITLVRYQPDGSSEVFLGTNVMFKTYQQ